MAEQSPQTPQEADAPHTDRPAVGIRVGPDASSEAVAGAILRAQRHGHQPFIVIDGPMDDEALAFADQLGAGVFESESTRRNGEQIRDDVSRVARSLGFPGLIWQTDPAQQVAYGATTTKLREQSTYSIDAIETVDADGSATVNGVQTV